MKGNNSIFLRRSFFPRYALGMPSFNNSVSDDCLMTAWQLPDDCLTTAWEKVELCVLSEVNLIKCLNCAHFPGKKKSLILLVHILGPLMTL